MFDEKDIKLDKNQALAMAGALLLVVRLGGQTSQEDAGRDYSYAILKWHADNEGKLDIARCLDFISRYVGEISAFIGANVTESAADMFFHMIAMTFPGIEEESPEAYTNRILGERSVSEEGSLSEKEETIFRVTGKVKFDA